jgi:acyl carrier protein
MGSADDFYEEARKITRDGIDDLLQYIASTDFFTAPASVQFHGAHEKGLVIHSLTVTDLMREIKELLDLDIPEESILICGLFHDVCKTNFYIKEYRNKKIKGSWHEVEVWGIRDQFPMGHGEKSVYLINKFMKLTDEEALAIRWHLGGFDPGVHFYYPSGQPQKQAMKDSKLVSLLAVADLATTYLVDEW